MKKNVAIFYGGKSEESEVSFKSALEVFEYIDKDFFTPYLVDVLDINTFEVIYPENKRISYDLGNNSWSFAREQFRFDCFLVMVHGKPAESGEFIEVLEKLGRPFVASSSKVMRLTFDKYKANCELLKNNIMCPISYLYGGDSTIKDKIKYPVILKPSKSGSSFGISKVDNSSKFEKAIELAQSYSDEIIVEEYLHGKEFSCGGYKLKGEYVILPIAEIKFLSEIFDYKAKYFGDSEEIIPAMIPDFLANQIFSTTLSIAKIFNLSGFFRIDYIYSKDSLYQLETNTIPGMSKESILPRMIKSSGLSLKKTFTELIKESILNN